MRQGHSGTGVPRVTEFTVDAKTLVLIGKSAAGQPVSETRTKMVRVQ